MVGSYFESWKKVEADAVERHRRAQLAEAQLREEVDIVKTNREKYKNATSEAFKEAAMEVDGISKFKNLKLAKSDLLVLRNCYERRVRREVQLRFLLGKIRQ